MTTAKTKNGAAATAASSDVINIAAEDTVDVDRPRQRRRLERPDDREMEKEKEKEREEEREEEREDEEEVTFLYKVVPGTSTRAYSLRCAREAGLPRAVLSRIDELSRLEVGGGEVKPVAMSSVAAARTAMHETIVQRLSAVNFDEPGAVHHFTAYICETTRGGGGTQT